MRRNRKYFQFLRSHNIEIVNGKSLQICLDPLGSGPWLVLNGRFQIAAVIIQRLLT